MLPKSRSFRPVNVHIKFLKFCVLSVFGRLLHFAPQNAARGSTRSSRLSPAFSKISSISSTLRASTRPVKTPPITLVSTVKALPSLSLPRADIISAQAEINAAKGMICCKFNNLVGTVILSPPNPKKPPVVISDIPPSSRALMPWFRPSIKDTMIELIPAPTS